MVQKSVTKIVTLEDIRQWLAQKPEAEVICWDTFEPHHCLTVKYYQEQGIAPFIRGEYDKTVRDSARRGKTTTETIAHFDKDLTKFKYALHYTPLRFQPTAKALLEYMESESWRVEPRGIPQFMPSDEVFNAMQDSPERPQDLPHIHKETVSSYPVDLYIYPKDFPSAYKDQERRSIMIVITAPQKELYSLEYTIQRNGSNGYASNCDYTGLHYRADASLFDGDIVTIHLPAGKVIGSWQRQNERLVNIG